MVSTLGNTPAQIPKSHRRGSGTTSCLHRTQTRAVASRVCHCWMSCNAMQSAFGRPLHCWSGCPTNIGTMTETPRPRNGVFGPAASARPTTIAVEGNFPFLHSPNAVVSLSVVLCLPRLSCACTRGLVMGKVNMTGWMAGNPLTSNSDSLPIHLNNSFDAVF
jgi:hypothetical protein